jgi:SAM-dependent methyltransferase
MEVSMPTLQWLRNAFCRGYSSGNILTRFSWQRWKEERKVGGSYRRVFRAAALPYLKPNSTVLEIGPGKGSWSRAILKYIPQGKLYTVDYLDVTPWLRPERYEGRLICQRIQDDSFSLIPDECLDFCWSFGVLCHNNLDKIEGILRNSLKKMKPGAVACHQYGDWNKLQRFGWKAGHIPERFQQMADEQIWWPRNSSVPMQQAAEKAGWKVLCVDLNLVRRDGMILLGRPC